MTKFSNFSLQIEPFAKQISDEFSDLRLSDNDEENEWLKRAHIISLANLIDLQTGGEMSGDCMIPEILDHKEDIFLVFDLANFFAMRSERNKDLAELAKNRLKEFGEAGLCYIESILNLALGDELAVRTFLGESKKEIPEKKFPEYAKYFKIASQRMVEKLTSCIVSCEDLKPDLEKYKTNSKELFEKLQSGETLTMLESVQSQSEVVKKFSELSAAPSAKAAARTAENLSSQRAAARKR